MKRFIRKLVAAIVRLTDRYACNTYGDMAELSSGPCQRCVGRAIHSPPSTASAGQATGGAVAGGVGAGQEGT